MSGQRRRRVASNTMETKFQFYEIVRVIAQPASIRESLIQKEGIILGMSDPDRLNKRYYGVHINDYGETFAVYEDLLESCGRIGRRQDAVSHKFQKLLKKLQQDQE
jgi:hypothetical protein